MIFQTVGVFLFTNIIFLSAFLVQDNYQPAPRQIEELVNKMMQKEKCLFKGQLFPPLLTYHQPLGSLISLVNYYIAFKVQTIFICV